jgi:hypothetical protein
MLAAQTSIGTWIAIGTIVLMLIPIYISSLKGAQSYGRLEQKVDALSFAQAQTSAENAATNKLIAETIVKLTDQFQAHALMDASNFGEIRGALAHSPNPLPKASP